MQADCTNALFGKQSSTIFIITSLAYKELGTTQVIRLHYRCCLQQKYLTMMQSDTSIESFCYDFRCIKDS